MVKCEVCDGRGVLPCDQCNGGYVVDSERGKERECDQCFGGEELPTCPACDGSGIDHEATLERENNDPRALTIAKDDGHALLPEMIREEFPEAEEHGDSIVIPVPGDDIDYDDTEDEDEYGLPESYADGLNREKDKISERIDEMRGVPAIMRPKKIPSDTDLAESGVELGLFQEHFESSSDGGLEAEVSDLGDSVVMGGLVIQKDDWFDLTPDVDDAHEENADGEI